MSSVGSDVEPHEWFAQQLLARVGQTVKDFRDLLQIFPAAALITGSVLFFLAVVNPIRIFDIYVPDIPSPASFILGIVGIAVVVGAFRFAYRYTSPRRDDDGAASRDSQHAGGE